jgi:transposase
MKDITLDQRLAIAKAYLDGNISIRTIADLSGSHASVIAKISQEVLGDKYFKTRYKGPKDKGTLL